MIRLAAPDIPEDDLRAVRDVLTSGWLVQGQEVVAFERATASFVGLDEAVAVNSGTSAIHTALLAIGIGPGDAVAVSAYSHVASANAIELCGATPVFVDIEPRTFNMDPSKLEEAMRARADGDHLAAILVVHAFGQMADLDSICDIARRYEVPVVEDAACALGAAWSDNQPGKLTRAACFSFHPRKAITTGEGGMIVTAEPELARMARAFRNHGQDPDNPSPDFVLPGLNYRMTEFQAVLGKAALCRLPDGIAARRRIAAHYHQSLRDHVQVPFVPDASDHVFQSYVVLLPADVAPRRTELISALADKGVESTIGTWSIPTTTYYRGRYGYRRDSFPITSDVFERAMALPMHGRLSEEDATVVARELSAALAALRKSST